jgi:hypothetical protein
MRKLSSNQTEVLECLFPDFTKLCEISDKFAIIQNDRYGYSRCGYVWKTKVCKILQTLVVRGLINYEYLGKYK